jgi:molybdate transport system substrate-binding protein
LLLASSAQADELLLFSAASAAEPLAELAKSFEAKTGHKILFSFGSSSDLARQIASGAPADLFLSADAAKVDGLGVKVSSRVDLLSNRMVVVVPARSSMRVTGAGDLREVRRLALAEPATVPAGIYARQWLEKAGVWDAVQHKVIPTLDVRAALATVATGRVEAGVVYETDARTSSKVKVALRIEDGPQIKYVLAGLTTARHPEVARKLVEHLSGTEAARVFEKYGFIALAATR